MEGTKVVIIDPLELYCSKCGMMHRGHYSKTVTIEEFHADRIKNIELANKVLNIDKDRSNDF